MLDDREDKKVVVDEWMKDDDDINICLQLEIDSYTFYKVLHEYDELPREKRLQVLLHLGKIIKDEIKDMDY